MPTPIRVWIGLIALAGLLAACGEPEAEKPRPQAPAAGSPSASPARGAVVEAEAFIAQQTIDKTNPRWRLDLPKPPAFGFEPGTTYRWVLETNQGAMTFRLRPDVAPMHVSSTIYLTRLGFFDGLGFHRVIQDFMAQGGDPLGVGSGGPGYQYEGEFSPALRHDRAGLLSMANRGPGTDGSQFFITFKPTPHLDDKHTIFGEIEVGQEVVERLNSLGQPRSASSQAPREPIVIERARIDVE